MKIKIGMVLPELSESRLRLAKQLGVDGIVAGAPPQSEPGPVWEYYDWLRLRKQIEDAGLHWLVCESIPIPTRVKLGLPGRDEDIDHFCSSLRHMGHAGIPILCYNWMIYYWFRTSFTTRVRGGALAMRYVHEDMEQGGLTELGIIPEQQLWDSLAYFLRAVVPVAEEVNAQLAMHPDDPPISPIRGVGRIMTSVADFQRMIDLAPSPVNGLTFCQGCFAEMGANLPEAIHQFGAQRKLFFVHYRNLTGTITDFTETFHDDGDVDMVAAMRAYYDIGFQGPMRPDHAPTMEGEDNTRTGYALLGKLFAVGYMRGVMAAIEKGG
jgi:mannonate dehydratase